MFTNAFSFFAVLFMACNKAANALNILAGVAEEGANMYADEVTTQRLVKQNENKRALANSATTPLIAP
jgi:hypothetical protein